MKKGLSLIVLIITIAVMLILLSVVVMNLNNDNSINRASETKVRNDIISFNEELEMFYSNCKIQFSLAGENFDRENVWASNGFAKYNNNDMNSLSNIQSITNINNIKGIIPSMNDTYIDKLMIIDGKLTYKRDQFDNIQEAWLIDEGVNVLPIIPSGFYYVGGSVEKGMVISDNIADTDKGDIDGYVTTNLQGNQFVWIPVPDINEFVIDHFGENNVQQAWWTGPSYNRTLQQMFWEPTSAEDGASTVDYAAILNSVANYKGFYIARYESSVDSINGINITIASKKSTSTRQLKTPDLSPGMLINYVSYDDNVNRGISINSTTNSGKGALTMAKEFASSKGYTSVGSNLPTGKQYDAIMRYIKNVKNTNTSTTYVKDSTGMGNYSGTLINTGSNPAYSVKNIYDLAGNLFEWTAEISYDATGRTPRGGMCSYQGNIYPSSHRSFYTPSFYIYSSIRPALYIK